MKVQNGKEFNVGCFMVGPNWFGSYNGYVVTDAFQGEDEYSLPFTPHGGITYYDESEKPLKGWHNAPVKLDMDDIKTKKGKIWTVIGFDTCHWGDDFTYEEAKEETLRFMDEVIEYIKRMPSSDVMHQEQE